MLSALHPPFRRFSFSPYFPVFSPLPSLFLLRFRVSPLLPFSSFPFPLYHRVHRAFPSVCRRTKVSSGGTLPSSFRDVPLNNSIRVWVISKGCLSVDSSARWFYSVFETARGDWIFGGTTFIELNFIRSFLYEVLEKKGHAFIRCDFSI